MKMIDRLNPLSGDVASSSEAMTVEQVKAIASKAGDAFKSWRETGPNERRTLLLAAATEMQSRQAELVDAMVKEIGATAGWAMFNLGLATGMIREYAGLTTQISGEIIPTDHSGCLSMAMRVPVGPILSIAPWNAPIILATRALALPLACGNTVILKASELCPRTHSLIVESFAAAGFPEGVVSIVTNAPEHAGDIVGALIDAPEVKRINFTGSTSVGKIIAKRAAEHLKPCLLELGGKAPLVILEDANLDEAVKAASFGAFMNQGQICMSTERIIVVDHIAEAFAEKFAAKVQNMPTGDPRIGETPLGAVVDRKTVDHVNGLIDDSVSKGGRLLVGGKGDSVLMPATVIDGVEANMRLYHEESFGPITAMIRARDEAHAIQLANDSDYGLSAAVHTGDIARGLRVAQQIESGICHVNGATVHDEAQIPFGGVKSSGYGKFGGKAGIESFTDTRWITIETKPGHYPI